MVSARIKDLRPAGMGEEHAQLAQWADAFCSGAALEEAQRRAITPVRADTAGVYRFLAAHPETDAAYVVNPGDYGICRALRAADPSGRIRIVTNDLTEDVEALMREGIVSATICQQPEAQGERPLELLFEYLAYGKAPETPCWYTDLSVHIAENAD